jgi:hypothetical protein
VRAIAENTVAAELNLSAYGLTAADLEPVCTIGVGDWVRLAPCDARRDAPQTYGQLTTGGKTGIVFLLIFGWGGVGWRGEERRGEDGTDPVSSAKEHAEHDAAPP